MNFIFAEIKELYERLCRFLAFCFSVSELTRGWSWTLDASRSSALLLHIKERFKLVNLVSVFIMSHKYSKLGLCLYFGNVWRRTPRAYVYIPRFFSTQQLDYKPFLNLDKNMAKWNSFHVTASLKFLIQIKHWRNAFIPCYLFFLFLLEWFIDGSSMWYIYSIWSWWLQILGTYHFITAFIWRI